MNQPLQRRALLSALFVFLTGSALHFVWEWSGRNMIVAIFAATNESTWEHLKLAFWPALALAPIQRMLYGGLPGWLPATAIRCMVPSGLIVALFYAYTWLLGGHHLVADIAIFAIAILVGEWLGHAALMRESGAFARMTGLGLLVVVTVLFATLTFSPPDCFLFQVPVFSAAD